MAFEPLRDDLKAAGAMLLAALDDLGMRPEGAGWLYFHDLEDWRFYLASSLVDLHGRKKVYALIVNAMSAMPSIDGLSFFDIHLESPQHIIFKMLSSAIRISGNGSVTIKDCSFNGVRVDAFLYRWDDSPIDERQLKMTAQRFKKNVKKRARERA